jgi:hypothetical protein
VKNVQALYGSIRTAAARCTGQALTCQLVHAV